MAIVDTLLLVAGIVLFLGKGSWMIAGYNTMNKEEKSSWNEGALARSTGKLLLVVAAYLALLVVAIWFGHEMIVVASIPFCLAGIIAWVVYVNKSPRFKSSSALKDSFPEP